MIQRKPNQARLQVESLEQRLTPSGYQVVYQVTNNWGSGLQGQMQIRNEEVAGLSGWTLEFDYAGSISSIWDAQIVSRVGNHYQIKNASWNKELPAGGSVSFGFIANTGGTVGNPTNFLLNGKPLDGGGPSLPTLKVDDISLAEGNSGQTSAVFTFLLSAPSASTVSVNYATSPGTAESGIDFVATSGNLTFSPGETRKTVSVPVKGDLSVEADESFQLRLSQVNGASLARSSANATIQNDDMGPSTGDVVFKVDSDWGSGFTGSITIKNSKTVEMKDWKLEFDFAGAIGSIWNARITSQSGNHFVVSPETWNSSIAAGKTVTFGFVGSPGNGIQSPTNFILLSNSGGGDSGGGNTGGGTNPGGDLPPATQPWPAKVYAPYIDATLWPSYDFLSVAKQYGLRYFTLAFITADPASQPAWGGYREYAVGSNGTFENALKQQIAGVRQLGGDVFLSFGGASGQELAEKITDITALKNAYAKVVTGYGATHLDFDIEGAACADRASVDRRSQALALLQKEFADKGINLHIHLTLPVLPSGLTTDGLYVVQSARKFGVKLEGVNIMTMDYGDSAAPNPQGRMGDYAIQAARSLQQQLRSVYGSSLSDASLWTMIGLTPMIGLNDVTTEVFDQQEAREMLDFAREVNLGRISMWSLNRDQQNPAGKLNYVDLKSSSILQSYLEFSLLWNKFTG